MEEARPIVEAGLPSPQLSAGVWPDWVRRRDAEIRARLEAGEEDTISNLLRFGVTFTREYRIDDEYFERLGQSSLVDSFAGHRADDLIRALAAPQSTLAEVKAFLEKKGYPAKSPVRLKQYLLQNLRRMHGEFLDARQHRSRCSRKGHFGGQQFVAGVRFASS